MWSMALTPLWDNKKWIYWWMVQINKRSILKSNRFLFDLSKCQLVRDRNGRYTNENPSTPHWFSVWGVLELKTRQFTPQINQQQICYRLYQVARLTSKSPQNATSAIGKVIFHTVYTKKYMSSSTNELLKPPLLNAKKKQTDMEENSD